MTKVRKEINRLRQQAKKRNAPICGNFTRRTLARIDGTYRCYLCNQGLNKNSATIDHVLPLSRGGFHCIKNAFTACHKCNGIKSNRTLIEYLNTIKKSKRTLIMKRVVRLDEKRAGIDCGGKH